MFLKVRTFCTSITIYDEIGDDDDGHEDDNNIMYRLLILLQVLAIGK